MIVEVLEEKKPMYGKFRTTEAELNVGLDVSPKASRWTREFLGHQLGRE